MNYHNYSVNLYKMYERDILEHFIKRAENHRYTKEFIRKSASLDVPYTKFIQKQTISEIENKLKKAGLSIQRLRRTSNAFIAVSYDRNKQRGQKLFHKDSDLDVFITSIYVKYFKEVTESVKPTDLYKTNTLRCNDSSFFSKYAKISQQKSENTIKSLPKREATINKNKADEEKKIGRVVFGLTLAILTAGGLIKNDEEGMDTIQEVVRDWRKINPYGTRDEMFEYVMNYNRYICEQKNLDFDKIYNKAIPILTRQG